MYKIKVPYKNLKGEPKNKEVEFHLYEMEMFSLFPQFTKLYNWIETVQGGNRTLEPYEVKDFFDNLQDILLEGQGVMSEDGESFAKGDKFAFKETSLFNAVMMKFVTDPAAAMELVNGLVPTDFAEMAEAAAKKIDENPESPEELRQRVVELRAQLEEAQGTPVAAPPVTES